jgi:hypothetical protein
VKTDHLLFLARADKLVRGGLLVLLLEHREGHGFELERQLGVQRRGDEKLTEVVYTLILSSPYFFRASGSVIPTDPIVGCLPIRELIGLAQRTHEKTTLGMRS